MGWVGDNSVSVPAPAPLQKGHGVALHKFIPTISLVALMVGLSSAALFSSASAFVVVDTNAPNKRTFSETLVLGAALMLPVLVYASTGFLALGRTHKSPPRTAGRHMSTKLLALAAFLSLAAATVAFWGRGRLWISGFYVMEPGMWALTACGVLYAAAFVVFRRARVVAHPNLFAFLSLGYLAWVLAFAVVSPALAPSRRLAHHPTVESAIPSKKGVPLHFLVFGDTGHRPHHLIDEVVPQAMAVARTHDLTGVLLLGDNLSHEIKPFERVFRKRFLRPFQPLLETGVPFYAILGNHDMASEEWVEGQIHSPLLNFGGSPYHAKTFGGDLVTVFFLLSEDLWWRPDQIAWFQRALAQCTSKWKLALYHRPIFGGEDAEADRWDRCAMMQKLIRAPNHIDVFITGHHHIYERRKLDRGVLFLTLGSSSNNDEHMPPDPQRVVGYTDKRCFASMAIDAESIRWKVLDEEGRMIDDIVLHRAGDPERLIVVPQTP